MREFFADASGAALMRCAIMRRACCIVNEMEFRMWRDARSFSPSVRGTTMKRFSWIHHAAMMRCCSAACWILAHLGPRTPPILESDTALERHCPTHPQYG
ncbi:hypothetical protein ACTGJ9_015900 [Bradyrhizobium sp. RDM12]